MRKFRNLYGPLLVIGAGLVLAGCQGVASTGGSGAVATAPSASSTTSSSTASSSRTSSSRVAIRGTTPKAPAGLKPYKNYSTTENLCAQTCKSEARCEAQTFKPIQEINGYIAGQCQFYGR
ncbi:hypothetical protein MNBD_ALPHA09-1601 [hydrothermal vent metagenome]|uniref:Uncharacterized protein n=1 Tax=hydrothermal vent metagenome TaxID=652676 RepID=A0A3B0T1M8_9ZZZZ